MSIWFPRVVGLLTALYGVSAVLKPDVIARHGELASPSDRRSGVALLSVTIGIRDLVSGIAIVLAPAGGVLLAALEHGSCSTPVTPPHSAACCPPASPAGRWPLSRSAGVRSRPWR